MSSVATRKAASIVIDSHDSLKVEIGEPLPVVAGFLTEGR
jgi:hypothetical protein